MERMFGQGYEAQVKENRNEIFSLSTEGYVENHLSQIESVCVGFVY